MKQKRLALLLCQARFQQVPASKYSLPTWEESLRNFYNNGSRLGFLLRLGCVQGLHSYYYYYVFIWQHWALVASRGVFCSGRWTLVVVPRLQDLGHTAFSKTRGILVPQ